MGYNGSKTIHLTYLKEAMDWHLKECRMPQWLETLLGSDILRQPLSRESITVHIRRIHKALGTAGLDGGNISGSYKANASGLACECKIQFEIAERKSQHSG